MKINSIQVNPGLQSERIRNRVFKPHFKSELFQPRIHSNSFEVIRFKIRFKSTRVWIDSNSL